MTLFIFDHTHVRETDNSIAFGVVVFKQDFEILSHILREMIVVVTALLQNVVAHMIVGPFVI